MNAIVRHIFLQNTLFNWIDSEQVWSATDDRGQLWRARRHSAGWRGEFVDRDGTHPLRIYSQNVKQVLRVLVPLAQLAKWPAGYIIES